MGKEERYPAATPDTSGAAIDVPDISAKESSARKLALTMASPGATMSTQVPASLNGAMRSSRVEAATRMMLGACGLVLQASPPLFPAARAGLGRETELNGGEGYHTHHGRGNLTR